ncbi:MAG: Npt1/Npt2 family nucleotide transporter [candidate division KSB1 bacterium]|jgi:AAA family ATP:ADP antiporter|nr:Npt1/Npt2 family nucleotide transporter [candidate division KSB1 bacterium]
MRHFLTKLFDIKRGEEEKALLMFLNIFLIIASLLIVKPVRTSLFLNNIGIAELPYAFILVAISAAIVTHLYTRWMRVVRLYNLILYTTIFSIIALFIFRLFLINGHHASLFYYIFYIWVALFAAIQTSQFWLMANYVFNAREAKRLFGFVGAGAISGGIFGGYLTKFLAPVIGTANMLFFCIAFLMICILILVRIWRQYAGRTYAERIEREKRIEKRQLSDNVFRIILNSRHLLYLSGIIGVGVIVANMVDYQYSSIASQIIHDEDRLTAFLGFWLSNLSIASLIVQLLLTGRILKLFGVTASLFFLPVSILVGAVSILVMPALWSAVLVKVSDGGFKQSINKAGLELLALPIPSKIKNRSKAFIDVFVDSLATGVGGILLVLFTRYVGFSVRYISIMIIVFIGVWLVLIKRIRTEYVNSFRLALEKGSIDLEKQTVNLDDASVINTLVHVFEGKNERQILYALKLLENARHDQLSPYFHRLLETGSAHIQIQVIRMLKKYSDTTFVPQIRSLVESSEFDVKVESMLYLSRHSENHGDVIKSYFRSEDVNMRIAALAAAAHLYPDDRDQIDIKAMFDRFLEDLPDYDLPQDEFNSIKANLARVIGISGDELLLPFLKNLLNDTTPDVVKAAALNAGRSGSQEFIPLLIDKLGQSDVRRFVSEALACYGENVIPHLERALENETENYQIRAALPRVLALIRSQKSVDVLINNLEQKDLLLRHQIIKSLNALKGKYKGLKFNHQDVRSHIYEETRYYYQILATLHHHSYSGGAMISTDSGLIERKKSRNLLIKSLEQKLEINLERIFRLLGLRYPQKDMFNAYLGIVSKKSDLKANAIEFLDNVLDARIKRVVIPIVEGGSPEQVMRKTFGLLGNEITSRNSGISYLLRGNDNWLKVCAMYDIALNMEGEYSRIVKGLVNDPDPMVRETAQFYLNKIEG